MSAEADQLAVGLDEPTTDNPALVRALVEAGAPVVAVRENEASLEDVYLRLIEEQEETERTGVDRP